MSLPRSILRSKSFKSKIPSPCDLNNSVKSKIPSPCDLNNSVKYNLPKENIQSLQGKVALLTSAANGIGYTTAWELVKRGANVCIVDTDRKRGEETATDIFKHYGPGRAVYCKGDVTDSYGMEAAFLSTIDLFSTLDIVINTSGIKSEKFMDKEIDVNVKGVINTTQLGFKYMSKEDGKHNGGVIVNVASIFGLHSCAEAPIYSGTKHFAIGYSRSMGDSFNFDKSGIRVMAICPKMTVNEISNEIRKESETVTTPLYEWDSVSKGIVQMIESGHSGSVWISSNSDNTNFEVQFPDIYYSRKQQEVIN